MAASLQEREQRDRERQTVLNTYMQAEQMDTQWAVDMTDLLTQTLASPELTATAAQDLECRATVCRLAVEHTTQEDLSHFSVLFPLQLAKELPQAIYFHQQDTDGRLHMVIYLGRRGHPLPSLNP
jgi:hypothetical protein